MWLWGYWGYNKGWRRGRWAGRCQLCLIEPKVRTEIRKMATFSILTGSSLSFICWFQPSHLASAASCIVVVHVTHRHRGSVSSATWEMFCKPNQAQGSRPASSLTALFIITSAVLSLSLRPQWLRCVSGCGRTAHFLLSSKVFCCFFYRICRWFLPWSEITVWTSGLVFLSPPVESTRHLPHASLFSPCFPLSIFFLNDLLTK